MWMNVLEGLIAVITMQHATTLKGVTTAHANQVIRAMGFPA